MSTTELHSKTGEISIHTENIFPIIKKWLYSEKEIFLRELISNSFDAINKLKKIGIHDGSAHLIGDGKIRITVDESAHLLTISDNGVGLTGDEIEKYITQIAFSGAEDFLAKYQNENEQNQIIGHFGLGFYSSFMVADLVEIVSRSYQLDSVSVKWSCDGSTQYHLGDFHRDEIGTDVILHLNSDNFEFANENRVREMVKKFANFLPVEIEVNGKKANDQDPLWVKHPNDVTAEEYQTFYQKLFPFSEPSLFSIHLNVDYPFHLKGILYFPKLMHELDGSKGQVQLYCQQVFVTNQVKEVLPEFLTLLRGAIDCPDIPLNVSRSYLQQDPYVQKISQHIIKKVADKLTEIFKQDRAQYDQYWADINPFIKYGMMTNGDFYDKVNDIVIYRSSRGETTSITDYLERNKEKLDRTILYSIDQESQATLLSLCKAQDLEVILLDSIIDSHFIQFLESKDSSIRYQAIDSDLSDHLIDQDQKKASEIVDPVDQKSKSEKLLDLFKHVLKNDQLTVEVQHLKSDYIPAVILESEYIKRIKHMNMMMKAKMPMADQYRLVLNMSNPIVNNLLRLNADSANADSVQMICQYIYDLALMNQRPLSGEQMTEFVTLSNQLLSVLSEQLSKEA